MTTNLPCPACRVCDHQNCESPVCICLECMGADDPREVLSVDLVWMMRRRVA